MKPKREESAREHWAERVALELVGRKIVSVSYMTDAEVEACGFDSSPVVLHLDNGESLYPMADDEGNDAGAMGTTISGLVTIPVIRE